MILVSETCCGRQRVSLKIVIHGMVIAAYGEPPHTYQCKQSGTEFRFSLTLISQLQYFTLAYTYIYVCDLHSIVSEFKAIL